MNILIFSWRGPGHPHAGGAEVVTHEHAKAWIAAGHTVTLFTSSFTNSRENDVIDGIVIKRKGTQVFGVQIAAFFWYLFSTNQTFDLVIDHFHGIPFFTPFYVRTKKLAFIHEVARQVWSLNTWPKPFNLIPSVIGRLGEPFIYLFYKSVPFITVSPSTKQDLEAFHITSKNIAVIENGVKTKKQSVLKRKTLTLISLGAIAQDKGTLDAIEAFAMVRAHVPDAVLWVVGKGMPDDVSALKRRVKLLSLEKAVRFFGYVTEERKFKLLSRAHLLINASVHEGWGLVNIEANSMKTPVVGYNVSGLKDSVKSGHNGVLVPLKDVTALSEVIVALWNNKAQLKKYSQNAEKWASQYTWENSTSKSLSLITKLCENKK